MKTLEEIIKAPRQLVSGSRAVHIETTEVFDVVEVGEAHAMCVSYGTPHTLALSRLVHYQDAVDCGIIDGWRQGYNRPNANGEYIVANRTGDLDFATYRQDGWYTSLGFGSVAAWRDAPALPEWIIK